MKRLLALRHLEEEREEAELRRQRRSREACLQAMAALDARRGTSSQELHAALEAGERGDANSAEMVLALWPIESHTLKQNLVQVDAAVLAAVERWDGSRLRRQQIESLVANREVVHRRECMLHEQKALDGWFLSSHPSHLHESFQREPLLLPDADGTVRAERLVK